MTDWDFAKHLITLMAQDKKWRYCQDRLREQLQVTEAAECPFASQTVIHCFMEEEIELGIAPSIVSINAIIAAGKSRGKGADCAVPGVYSVNNFAGNASTIVDNGL